MPRVSRIVNAPLMIVSTWSALRISNGEYGLTSRVNGSCRIAPARRAFRRPPRRITVIRGFPVGLKPQSRR